MGMAGADNVTPASPIWPPLGESLPRPAWNGIDVLFVALLLALTAAVRSPSLHEVVLNTDESYYEAAAAYLVANQQSTFAVPSSCNYMIALYRVFAVVFGPYSMVPIRVFMSGVVFLMALQMYAILRRHASRGAGLVAGGFFVIQSLLFEGHSANREWPANLALFSGAHLFLSGLGSVSRRGTLEVLGSGFVLGTAVWMKDQSLPIVLAPSALLAYHVVADRSWGQAGKLLLVNLAGLALAALAYFIPFALAGGLGAQIEILNLWLGTYLFQTTKTTMDVIPVSLVSLYSSAFYRALAFRYTLILPYGFAILALLGMLARVVYSGARVPSLLRDRAALLFVFWSPAAAVAIQAGHRYFSHYFLYLAPPIAVLLGFALHGFWNVAPRQRWSLAVSAFLLFCYWREFFARRLDGSYEVFQTDIHDLVAGASLVVLVIGYVVARRRAWKESFGVERLAWVVAWSQIVAGMACMVIVTLLLPISQGRLLPGTANYLLQAKRPGDSLFVWGWLPELYSQSKMEPASRFTTCASVMNDLQPDASKCRLVPRWSDELMRDLERKKPRFIVDAWRRSYSMSQPWIYQLQLNPVLANYIGLNYRYLGNIEGCDIYERM